MTNQSTKSLVFIAIGTAIIAALSQISLSIGPVPFTLQTLAIGLVACLYKPKEAITSVSLYLVLGAIGLPVFAGFSGGFAALTGPTSGFLWGFLLYTIITSALTKSDSSPVTIFLACLLGTSICFLLGCFVFKLVSGASWTDTIGWTVLPFILPDLAKITLVMICHRLLQPVIKKEAYFS
ncbi:TPA: biotin transporter BioY [Streptococcus suis]|nr:biotin transporter BioY [Streptococcus suis]HEP1790131.1 biotin transporter BioY [Streptococcus suis]HEP1825080.1 biotin transporter BioY [Streptococcus suis]HEP1841162.1 biotin transporter BioY [Streptococcus suis]